MLFKDPMVVVYIMIPCVAVYFWVTTRKTRRVEIKRTWIDQGAYQHWWAEVEIFETKYWPDKVETSLGERRYRHAAGSYWIDENGKDLPKALRDRLYEHMMREVADNPDKYTLTKKKKKTRS